jgi:solute carrier family 39 (zinc transporter), member 7
MFMRLFVCILLIHISVSSLSEEDPSYKYSKEANTKPAGSQKPHGHSHSHHGHSHDHHGHSHDHHGHSHDHHGHSHDHHGHSHDHHGHDDHQEVVNPTKWVDDEKVEHTKEINYQVWLEALGCTAIISVAPIFILFFVPLDNTAAHEPFLKVLLSFASGGLLGDAFLHLIPHALDPHDPSGSDHKVDHDHHDHGHSHDHDHSAHMYVGLWIVAGIMTFLLVEKVIRFYKVHPHSHGHSHGATPVDQSADKEKPKSHSGDSKETTKGGSSEVRKRTKSSDKTEPTAAEESSDAEIVSSTSQEIKVAGYLNLAADFAHNFTDGLAIGASFLIGQSIGIVTTVTIFFHEIPHEIGDFAILIQSGCSRRRAMLLQFSTAIGAMLGTLVSLIAGSSVQYSSATNWVLPFTAGGFIYIATVSVIPELLKDTKPWQSFKEIVALLVGVFMMVIIAQYE